MAAAIAAVPALVRKLRRELRDCVMVPLFKAILLPLDLMLLAPLDGDLLQGFLSECKPGFFDVVPVDRVFEVPERSGAVQGTQQLFTTLYFKSLHDVF
jgi:hypothetical protein